MAGGVQNLASLLGKVNSANALVVTLDGGNASADRFYAGNGTAALPSFTFTSTPDLGLHRINAAAMGVSVSGGIVSYFSTGGLVSNTLTLDVSNADVVLSRGAANRLDLATGDSFRIVSGGLGVGATEATAGNVTAAGTVTTGAGTLTAAPLVVTNGTNLTTATANAIENDGTSLYWTTDTTNGRKFNDNWNYFRLTGSGTGITSIADFFGSNDGIPLVANGVYEIEWNCYFSQATAGIATWTIVTATTALATLTGEYEGSNIAGIQAVGTNQTAAINTTASSSTAFPVTGTEATGVTHYFKIRAMLTAGNGASNTRLRLTMSAGTATPLINSYFRVRRLSGANVGAFVA